VTPTAGSHRDVPGFREAADALIGMGQLLYGRGWVPATSGNFSVRLPGGWLVLTVSGCHKGRLTRDDLLLVDPSGVSLDGRRPSAETGLHVQIYRRLPEVGCVLHPHTVSATLLSRLVGVELVLEDYELLKAFPGVDSHQVRLTVPVLDNDQDIPRLAAAVDDWMDRHPTPLPGYLIRGHGFYAWGRGVDDALRHLEAFEFLFECELKMRGLRQP
jgi:methylthioribulose-1-phosphate dehydratase